MKQKKGNDWFPFWIDKWLFGSTRDELTIEQCAVWVDFLAISNKDEGYIRANVGMPYPIKRLAGLLNRPEKLIKETIKCCLDPKVKKLRREPDGTLYVLSHQEYELSKRHKRRIMSEEKDTMSGKADPREEKSREEKSREEKSREEKKNKNSLGHKKMMEIFEEIWGWWWRKEQKGKAKEKFLTLVNTYKVDPKRIKKAVKGYLRCEKSKGTKRFFIMYLKTFLYAGNKKRGIPGTWEAYEKYGDDKYKLKAKL